MPPAPIFQSRKRLCDFCALQFLRRYHRARGRVVELRPCTILGEGYRVHYTTQGRGRGRYDRRAMAVTWKPTGSWFLEIPTHCTCAQEGKGVAPQLKHYGKSFRRRT